MNHQAITKGRTTSHRAVDSDYELGRSIASGAIGGIGDLYERHQHRVFAQCLRMTGNPAEAEDLTQDVFIHLLRTIHSFQGKSQFSTWLYRLTVNHVLMHFRRIKSHREKLANERAVGIGSSVFGMYSPTRGLDGIALHSALARLSPGCRKVLLLFDLEGYKHEEIANLLGCSVGTSKSQLHRARMKLRRLLRN